GAGAALGRREPTALRGDRAALHAVRRRHAHGHDLGAGALALAATTAPADRTRHLVHLRRAHADPHLREHARHLGLYADVARLVVTGAVPREEHRRQLVERQLAVGRGIPGRAIGDEELLLGVALGRAIAERHAPTRHRREPRRYRPPPEPAHERLSHVAHRPELVPDERRA